MKNSEKNKKFLTVINKDTKLLILENIAAHYQISNRRAFAEVTSNESEHLLDYITGPIRKDIHFLMKSYKLAS